MARTYTPDEIALTTERALRLKALSEHPAWADLRAQAEEDKNAQEKRLFQKFTARIGKNGKVYMPPPVDQRQIDQNIGFWEGVFTVLNSPDKIIERAERMLDTAESAQQEGDT